IASATANIRNSLFIGNSAYSGGAVYTAGGTTNVHGCAIFDNTATNAGDNVYIGNGNYNFADNWWGSNKGPENTVRQVNTIVNNFNYYILTETQTTPTNIDVKFELSDGATPSYVLPLRHITVEKGLADVNVTEGDFSNTFSIYFTTNEQTSIGVTVDHQTLNLNVFPTPKENINQLDVTVQNVILPGVAEIVVDSDVSGTFDVTIGEETKEITLTDGHGTLPWDALPEGSYFVVVSRTNDPVYNDKVAYTSFKVEKADVSISISASDNEIEYGETVTITPTITPDTITANDITYYVDGTAVSSAALSDLSVGTHTVVAKYAGDENYKADESNVVIITVSKATPVISVTGDTKTFPEDVVIGLTFTGVNNAALPGATIRVTVNGVTYAVVTDDEGKASLTIKGLAVGNYDIVAESIADESYEAASNSAEKVVVTNAAITVSGEGDSVTYPEKGIIIINTNVAGAYTIKIGDKIYENVALLAGENSFEVKDVFNVGTYDIKVSANINNYDELVDEFIATYTVSPRTVFIEVDTFGGVDFGGEGEIEVRLYDAGTDERIKDNVTLIFTDANGNVLETTTVETIVGPWERGDKLDFTADWPMGDYYVTVENPNYIFVKYDDSEYKFTSFGDEAGEIEYSTGTVEEIENDLDDWWIKVRVLTNDADESYVGKEYYIDPDAYFDTERTYELMVYDGENLIGTGIWVLISKEIIPLNPPKYDYPVHKVGIGVELVSGDRGYIFGYEHEVVLKLVKYGEEDDEGEPVEINCPATIVVLKFNGETEEWEEIATIDDLSFANGRISIDCTDFKPGEYKLKVSISDETYEIRMWNEEADSDVDYRIFWEEGSLFQVDNDHVYIENVIGEESTRFGDEHDFSFEVWHAHYDDEIGGDVRELFAHDFDATVKVYKWNDDTEEYDLVETIPVEISGGKIQAIDFSKLKVGRYKVTVKLDDPNYSFEEWDDDIGADVDYAMRYFDIYQDNIHANVEGRDWTQYGQDRIFKFDLTHWDDEVNEDVLFVYDTNAIVKVYKLTWDDEGTESAELINTYSVAITGGHSEAIDLSDLNAGSYRVTIQLEDEDYELDYWFNDQYGIQEERFDVDKANVDMTVVFDKPEGYVYGDDVTVIVTVTPQTTDEKLNEVIELNIMGKESQRKTLENGVARFTLDGYDAGLYTIWVNFFGTENYHDQYNYIAGFDIVKANPEINVIPKKDEYAYGEDVVIEVTLKDGETGLTATAIVNLDGTDYLVNINEGTGTVVVKGLTVGEYPITANVAGTDNYNAVSYEGDAKAVVNKGDLTIVAQTSDPSVQYGEEIIFSYTLNAPEGAVTTGNVKYYVDGNQITGDRISSLGIGTHTLVAEYTGDPNFNDVSSTQVSFTVTKADPVLVISANATEIKYPESIKLSGTITPGDATGSIVYYLDGTPIDGDVLARLAPGVYTVTAKYGGNDNYNEVDSSNSLEITVAKGDVSIEVTAGTYTIGYGDDLFISRILNPADASVAVTYIVDGEEVDYQLISGLSAGTHTIAAKASESVYYNGAISETKVVTVSKAVADVTVTTDPVTYPNVATVVVNSNVPGTYTIRVGNKDYAVVVGDTGSGSVVIDKLEPGTYDVVLSADLGGNYESVVQIPAASLTVNAQTGPFVVSSNGLGYATLAEALAVAQATGDTITVVEAGTYTGEGNIGVTIDKDVIIKAGEGLDVIFDAAKADTNILTIAKEHAVTLSGLAFTGVDNTNTKFGAVVNHGQLTVTDCEFYDNLVHVAGTGGSNGAAAIFSATDATGLTITGSTFTNNKAVSPDFNTGGIGAVASWATSGEVLIKDSVFESNEARYGGAVEFENLNQMTPAVLGCNFTNNIAYVGAGINFNDGCKLEQVTNCTFTGNTIRGPQGAPTTGSMGAAICAGSSSDDSVLMVDGCKFIGNKGDASDGSSGGAIRLANKASGIIVDSEFIGNEARIGSAISIGTINNDEASLVVENCNFTDNNALMYGAVSVDSEAITTTIADSSFSGNTAPENRNIFNMGTLQGVVRNTF
ncbi:MAG: Ig-like domain repeat protein, partial [Methanobrevibacter sp.]|nr:Ig-like domain repeat protein [Methanobrevibacter sp.]